MKWAGLFQCTVLDIMLLTIALEQTMCLHIISVMRCVFYFLFRQQTSDLLLEVVFPSSTELLTGRNTVTVSEVLLLFFNTHC